MIVIYLLFDVLSFWLGYTLHKTIFNSICLYSIVWGVALLLHQSGLILFHELKWYTWVTIFLVQIIFVLISYVTAKVKTPHTASNEHIDENIQREVLKKYILITSVISGVAIVGNYIAIAKIYGNDLLSIMTDLYTDRVNNNIDVDMIPYLGVFVYIAIALCGLYVGKFGFNVVIIFPVVLGIMNSLTSGGRAELVFMMIIFVVAFFSTQKLRFDKKTKILMCCGVIVLGGAILIISNARNAGSTVTYATSLYKKIFGDNVLIYKIVQYISAPIGVLNEYLADCDFDFGKNTFLTVYNFLSKFNLVERPEQYQEVFLTPVPCNVGTWVRELVEDFTYPGMIIAVAFFSIFSSYFCCKAVNGNLLKHKVVWSIISVIVVLSFFDWKFRSSNIWISLLFGYIIGGRIDQISSKCSEINKS